MLALAFQLATLVLRDWSEKRMARMGWVFTVLCLSRSLTVTDSTHHPTIRSGTCGIAKHPRMVTSDGWQTFCSTLVGCRASQVALIQHAGAACCSIITHRHHHFHHLIHINDHRHPPCSSNPPMRQYAPIDVNRHLQWMEEILHQLISYLTMFNPWFIGFQHVSTIQGGAGFLPSTVAGNPWNPRSDHFEFTAERPAARSCCSCTGTGAQDGRRLAILRELVDSCVRL